MENQLKYSQTNEDSKLNITKVGPKTSLLFFRIISFFLVFLIWELAGRSDISIAFPPFSKVFLAFIEMTLSGEFVEAYADSLPPLLIGLLITVVGGVIIGVSVGLVRSAEWFIMPLPVSYTHLTLPTNREV